MTLKDKELLNAKSKEVIEMKVNGKSYFGSSIVINGSSVIVDGSVITDITPNIRVEILGGCDFVNTQSGDVVVHEAAQTIKTMSGDITCKNVFGSVSTMSGDVKCGDVSGSISTMSGDITNKGCT